MPCVVQTCIQHKAVGFSDVRSISLSRSRRISRIHSIATTKLNIRLYPVQCSSQGRVDGSREVFSCTEPSRRTKLLKLAKVCVPVIATLSLAFRSGKALAAVGKSIGTNEPNQLSAALVSAWAGLVAGGLHTLTGPDHLAALAPLCIGRGSKLESAAVGALWGLGHDAGQVVFGFLFLLLKDRLQVELLRTWGARIVGLTLITIGAIGIKEAQEVEVLEEGGDESSRSETSRKKSLRFTFVTGLVYGLQPDALFMILPALAMPSPVTGASFLAMFLVGTVLAMSTYTVFLDSCSQALQKKLPWITKKLSFASSLVAIAFGFGVLLSEFFGLQFF